jgi:hypothetical protein
MKNDTCSTETGIGYIVTSLLLMAVGVVGFINGLDMLDFTWLLLGSAYLVGGAQSEQANVRWYFTSMRGVATLILLGAAIVLMLIEIIG